MNIIRLALRRPVAIMVAAIAVVYFSFTVIRKINVDIFPSIESPAIYIAMPYGGLTPSYMDGFMAAGFQKVLIFVSGVKDIEFKSVQGFTLMKLSFYPGTNMAQAAAEVSAQVSRAMGFLPAGAVPPQVVRFDGSSLPVGQLVFESPQRSLSELQNLVLTRIRPMFVNIPGITAPAPFGGNVRSIVVNVDRQQLQSYGISPEEITTAIAQNNLPAPAGNVRIGDQNLMAPVNSIASGPEAFLNIPVKQENGTTVFVKDVASVTDGADQTVGYALVNGRRSVYLPVIKKADASTLDAVNNLKAALPALKNALPEDVQIRYVFDQSGYIEHSLANLVHEGLLGALLTGLMVFLFLRDFRGSLIVVLTIPVSILAAVMLLYVMGQTVNVMTLTGLALAIGILVDEATVTIENIHQHLELHKPKSRAILDALLEISVPKLLILLCILAVLTPSVMMTGIPRDMFMPLSMAVAFAMIASFIASQTFVPVLANWLMKNHSPVPAASRKRNWFERFRLRYAYVTGKLIRKTAWLMALYVLVSGILITVALMNTGTDVMPPSGTADLQLRIEAPQGSRLEKTEAYVKKVTRLIRDSLPAGAVTITSAYAGTQPSSTAINPVFLFTSTSGEAVLQLSVDRGIYTGPVELLKEKIRNGVRQYYPELAVNFEPVELMEKIMSQGSMTPVEITVAGNPLKKAAGYAQKVEGELKKVPFLRDVRIAEPLQYPSVEIEVDRERAAQFGLTMEAVTRSLVSATSSTRFTNKNLWVDPRSGLVFQVQVQFPEGDTRSLNDLRILPLKKGSRRPVLEDVATLRMTRLPAQVNRQGPNRYVTLIANTYQKDLGAASKAVEKAIQRAGEPPRGVIVKTKGMMQLLKDTTAGLQNGLLVAIVMIFLLLAAYYQSFRVPALILAVIPAVLAGSLVSLLAFGSTLNLQSYMGIIMSIGVSVSNAVLLINQAELYRKKKYLEARQAAQLAAASRLRPVMMTTMAMIAGMIPMASGMGEGGGQVAPLGQAVIGGLILSVAAILLVLPGFYTAIMKKASRLSPSLDPDDPDSRFAGTTGISTTQL